MFDSRMPFGVRWLAHKEGQKKIFLVIWSVNRMSKLKQAKQFGVSIIH